MRKYLSLIVVLLFFISLFISCNPEPTFTAEEREQRNTKTYSITTYDLSQESRMMLKVLLDNDAMKKLYSYKSEKELLKDLINRKLVLENLNEKVTNSSIKKYYQASEIISYSDADCRFVDKNTGMEKFISADYIKIK